MTNSTENMEARKVGGISSDGSTASYYEIPEGTTQLQELISYKNMNAQIGEIFRECYRYGESEHSSILRGVKKIIFYAEAEKKRVASEPSEPSIYSSIDYIFGELLDSDVKDDKHYNINKGKLKDLLNLHRLRLCVPE